MSKKDKSADSDIQLWQLVTEGDMVAFRKLFYAYYAPLCRFAEFWLRDKGSAEEVVLDLYTHLWLTASDLEIRTSVKSYLYRAVRNRALNKMRVMKISHLNFEELEEMFYYEEYQHIETEELMIQVQEAIDMLPPCCKKVFVMSRQEYKSHQEIAEELNISTKTIESHITLAIDRIRKHLDKNKI